MKATGFSGNDVKWIFILLSMVIGITGGLFGLLFGFIFTSIIDVIPFSTAALPTIAVGSSLVTTGLYSESLGTLSFTNTGVKTGAINSTGLTMVGKLEGSRAKVGLGTTSLVSYGMSGNGSTNTGLYSSTEGTINVSSLGNNVLTLDASGNLTAGTFNGTSTNSSQLNGYTQSVYATANTIALRDAYGNLNAVLFQGTATTARYADLAEKYETDREYPVGTVLEVQGEKEVTLYKGGALAGVISENPGLMINAEGEGQYVALKGKVPVICEGDVYKGQYCLAIAGGKVQGKFKEEMTALDVLNIVGVALEDSKNKMVQVKI